MSGKIIFFEERNVQGHSHECISDCSETASHLRRCSSCRVESGIFMGQQYLLTEYQNTISFRDCIQSCRLVPGQHKGPFRIRIYEKANFEGQMHELIVDCDSIQDSYHTSDMQSCHGTDGYWQLFEQANYEGRICSRENTETSEKSAAMT